MFDRDKWQEIFQVLAKNKMRTALTAFGVFWGIFMLVIMLGSGRGLENGVINGFSGYATNCVFIWTQATSMPYKGFPRGRRFNLRNGDVQYLKDNLPEMAIISPRNQLGGWRGGNNVIRGLKTGAFSIFGDYPQFTQIEALPMREGRFINQLDIERERKVAVIGSRVITILFEPDENPIGEYIQINGVNFKVVGTFDTKKSGDDAEEDTQSIYVPFSTFQKVFNYGDLISWFSMTSAENVPASVMEEKAKDLLKVRHSVAPQDNRAFGSSNLEDEFDRMTGLFLGIKSLSWFVGTLTLLAGVIGVSNIMLIIVKERTREIGIRRAIGATPGVIVTQIILESLFLTALAGILGLMAGIWLLEGVGYGLEKFRVETGMFSQPEVGIQVTLVALFVLVVSGTLAGLIPARRALSIRPVNAIKSE